MSMFNDISCDKKGNEEECVANSKVVSILAKKFGIGQWSFTGPGSEKKWYSMKEKSTRNLGQYRGKDAVGIRRKRVSNLPCNNSFCPGVISKAKDTENCRYILLQIKKQLRPFFA